MKSTDPLLGLELSLPPAGSRRRVHELHRQLKEAILAGRLAAGLRLPATRVLADALGAARNTVVAAYDLLLGDGYVEARPGSGYRVARTVPQPSAARTAPRARPAPSLAPAFRGLVGHRDAQAPAALACDFRLGVPDETALDFEAWRRLSARGLRSFARHGHGYAEPRGEPALRAAIAAHVSFARAVACGADDVVVTAGAQQAFDLLARILVTPGRTVVAVEQPGYPPARAAFEAAGARIAAVPVDREGLIVERLPANARVIYVTPSHQFPLGCALSPRRRAELLAFARRHHATIVEDDYDGEFRFDGRALDALQTLDREQSVFYVGTFSKSLFPSLRLGYVVAPPWALLPLAVAKQRADWHCNLLAQETLAAFIAEGHLVRHVRRMRARYARRRAALLDRLARDFRAWLAPVAGSAGLHLAALAAPGLDAGRIARDMRERGVGVYAIGDYGPVSQVPDGLLFGYGALGEDAISVGLARLHGYLTGGRNAGPRA